MDNSRQLIRRETLLAVLSDTTGGRMARLDRILEAMELDSGLLGGLAPGEFYFLLKDIGPMDAAPLLKGATDDQLARVLDFESWEHERFAPARFTAWLNLALSESDEVAVRMLKATDPEMIAMRVMSEAQVIEVDKTPEQVDLLGGRDEVFQSPDNDFWLICVAPEAVPELKRLVDLLYATDLEWARGLLKASAWELLSSLEDETFRFRTARLGEEGFPSQDEALELYATLDLRNVEDLVTAAAEAGAHAGPQVIWDLQGRDGHSNSLLSRGLATLRDGPRKASVIRSLAHLLGEVIMVDTRGDFSDGDAVARAPSRLHGFVSIGLDHLGDGSPEEGGRLLRRVHVRLLFRVGYTLSLRIRNRARACLHRAAGGQGFRLLDEAPWGQVLEAAAEFVPQVHRILDGPDGTTTREIRGRKDLELLQRVVDHAQARLDFVMDELGADIDSLSSLIPEEEGRAHVTCTTIVATALLNSLLDRPLVSPMSREQLGEALGLWMPFSAAVQQRIPDELVLERLTTRFAGESKAVQALIAASAERLKVTFADLPGDSLPDPRFIGAAVLVG